MFRSRIRVDLPSVETERSPSVREWLRSLFGAQLSLRSGREELTVGAFSLIEGLIEGFARAGVDDVIAFLVDRQVVYCDQNEVAGDLPLIVRAAEVAGILDRPFREMHLVLAHQDASLHTIIDCQIKSRVFLGDAEMSIDLSSRSSDLRVRAGETAEQYAERIKAFAAKPDSFEPGRRWVDALMRDIASSLEQVLVGARVSYETTVVKLIRPGVQQIGRFGNLRFGADVQAPQYRPIPTLQRTGAYADPFYYYYYDPYYDFMNYVLVDTLQRGSAWRSRAVQVMDPGGLPLFDADSVPSTVYGDYWLGRDAVSYDSRGSIMLRPSQPTWPDNDRGTSWLSVPQGASHTSSGSSSSDSSSWSDRDSSCGSSSSSSDSSSSCGSSSSSSDSSSSCGSSCSSGSSCGSSCSSGSSCNSS